MIKETKTLRGDTVLMDVHVFEAFLKHKKPRTHYIQDGRGYVAFIGVDKKNHILHRWIYKNFVGEIEGANEIHHKDRNKFNNTLENLEQVCPKEHSRRHHIGVGEFKIPYIIKRKVPGAVRLYEFRLFKNRKLISERFHTLEEAIAYRDITLPKYGIPPVETSLLTACNIDSNDTITTE